GEFVWTKFVGTDGATGAQGPQGVPGTSAYTWIRYATSAGGADMSTSPAGMTYIGVLTTDTNVLPAVGEFVWTKFVGDNGLSVWIAYSANADGSSMTLTPQANSKYIGIKTAASRPDTYEGYDWTQYRGNDGADGADGQSVYVAYSANADGSSMTTTKQADTKFIGIATGTSTPATYEGYSWFQLVGDTGATGATGLKGDKGDTGDSVWFAYAKDGIGTDMSTTWSAGLDYVGFATGTSQPDLASAYAWSKFVGPQGPKGDNAYVHIRYSAKSNGGNADGSEMTTTVNTYIGIYTDNNATASTNPSKYTWGQLKGDKGDKGDEGTSQYVNIRYATSDAGADFDDDPAGMSYLGILVTTTSDHEDIDNPAKYTWVKFVGPQGPKGNPGTNGTNGDYVKVVPHATKEKVLVLTLYRGEADESDPENIKPAGSVIASYEIPYCGYGIAAIEENEKYVQFNILDNTGETPVTKGYRLGKTKVVPTSIKIANPVFDGVIAGYSGANGGVQTLKLHVSPSDALLTPGNVHIDYVGKGTISSITRAADDRFNDKAFFNVTGVTRTDATKGDWDVTFTVNQNALEEGATPESISTLFTGMLFDVCVTYPKNPESLNTILSSDSDYELPESYSDWATSYSRSTNSFTFTNKPMVLNNFEVTMTPATATITSNVANVEAVSNLLITSEYNYPSSYVDVSDHTVTARAFDKNGNPLDNLAGFDTSGKAYYTSLTRDAGTVANAAYSYILKPNQAGFTALRAANLATFAVGCKIVFTISVRYSYNGTYGAEPETFTVTVTYDDDPLDLPSFNATLNRVNGWVHGTNSASDVEYCVYASQVGSIPTVPGDEIPYSNGISTALVNNSANNYGSIMYSGKSIYNHLATNGYDVENAVIKYEYTLIKEYMRTKNSGITGVAWGDWKDVTPGTHIEVAPNGQISITTAYNPGSGALNKNKEDGMIQVECVITIDNRTWGTFYLVIRTQD
ncbi:hypothetical protein LJC45_05175, partial [Alistipes sp. OttesenSCG-928-B03]|nr:hypothetical protein [Alistipes sp. OttesenSCG-928-B03]